MQNQDAVHKMVQPHLVFAERQPRQVAKILIVDDDVDSAISVQSPFSQMGCTVEFALSADEAQRKISSCKSDIIILDWMLDHRTRADEVVAGAMRLIAKFATRNPRKLKIITFSSRTESEIILPPNDLYEHIAHWRKPLQYPELTRRTVQILNYLGF
ncbi:MAG: hypothetical protein AB7G93_00075 [Bdellovibrionales bacterium]